MRLEVVLTEGAEHDIEDLHTYIATYDSLQNADHLLDRLTEVAENLG